VSRVFCLTFETDFFGTFGFRPIDGAPVPTKVYEELLRSYDEGVAEFLDLERVKPNTLGNTRMLLHLGSRNAADLDAEAGTATDVTRQMQIVRLGEGVDRTGELAPAAIERTRV